MSRQLAFLFVALASQAAAAEYAGARACEKCHVSESRAQARTGHANALHRPAKHPLAASFIPPSDLLRPPNFRFDFKRTEDGIEVRFRDAANVASSLLDWAFGAGAQAVTFVTRADSNHYLEHYWSYYAASKSLGPTPGHRSLKPAVLGEAAGLFYRTRDPDAGIIGCFACHSTGAPRIDAAGEIHPSEAGVRCEACHGPAAAHAAGGGKERLLNPRRMSASAMNDFCGRCHRPPASNPAAIDWSYAWNVRHQPVYFSQSECFRKSSGAFSCVTCHSPHASLETRAAAYDVKCAGCHSSRLRPPAANCREGCVTCHMPRVSPEPPLRFTNHWIGVYGSGAQLKPRSR